MSIVPVQPALQKFVTKHSKVPTVIYNFKCNSKFVGKARDNI